jgi:hypothetical protein
MGIQNGQDQARQVVTGTFTAAGQSSASFAPDVLGVLTGHPLTKFSVAAWSASPSANTVADIQRSYDGGTNWLFGDGTDSRSTPEWP